MDKGLQKRLVFHGAIVVLLGLLLGFPFGFVILGTLPGSERAWRMAHLEGLLNGLLVIGVAAVAPSLRLGGRQGALLFWSLIVTAYGNTVAAALGATFGVRGLAPGGPVINTVVYVLFMVAVATVAIALGLVAAGARARDGGRPAPGA
jgi:hypothetical protein